MNKALLLVLVLAVVVTAGYLFFTNQNQIPTPQSQTVVESTNTTSTTAPTEPTTAVVRYTNAGYAPLELTIKVGDTVTFKNESSSAVWTASAMHPSHTVYSGTSLLQHCPDTSHTSFDQCGSSQPKGSWSFTFTKAGTWGYHNHMNASYFGKIIVE